MANERTTEDIVREHFKQFRDEIVLEEQQSAEPRIRKLLSQASKSGLGHGQPEFIIRFNEEAELLIVIECKEDITKHESPTRARPRDYAVDGTLHYASYLSENYDVLALAVSGTDAKSARISHFFKFRSEREPRDAFGHALLPVDDYLQGYRNDPIKYRQDFHSLQKFIRQLNIDLHKNKVSEKNRSLLISAVMIALERRAFRKSYQSETDSTQLAKSIVDSVITELKSANIGSKRLNVLEQKFGFLPLETELIRSQHELRRIVSEIDREVNSFVKTHQYRDVLGTIYVEFLRHANSDKGLGIVLTPPHITELFAELAQVRSESVVYDSCAGTGGFLISAMKRMIDDAKGSTSTENSIKSDQLYGVEIQSDIYPLAVSNMLIHQDGKSNIELGSCFDSNVMNSMKEHRPTVGMLNPPYKSDKKEDIEELQFVLNNLECLTQGSICVAIVPMQCALAVKGTIGDLKRQLMEKHTLRAVLSMPDELFFNSDVGVVSCIMVFEAWREHPMTQEVFLGYYKDDGFVKRKVGGRFDAFGKWDEIRCQWLDLYFNRRTVPGLSVNRVLTSADEWAAEAYMETDYGLLTDNPFDNTLHEYSAYLFANRIVPNVSDASSCEATLALDVSTWKEVKIADIFKITGSQTTPLRELHAGDYGTQLRFPFVTTQATNNGVRHFFGTYTERGGVLVVDSAVAGYCSYQAQPFTASDHVEKLIPKFSMNSYVAMFLVTIINLEQYRYNYGRKCSQTRMRRSSIRLPLTDGNELDLAFMEEYIKSRPYSSNLPPP